MPSNLVLQTAQGAVLSIISNGLAQGISAYRHNTNFSLKYEPIVKFAIFSVISNPPNILWQTLLEDYFPTNVPFTPPRQSSKADTNPSATTTRTSKRNVLIKFLADQTIGALINNLMFLVFMAYWGLSDTTSRLVTPQEAIAREVLDKLPSIMIDGYKVWPLFSLLSFLFIPVDKRVVAGCLVGVGWNIYLSLIVEGTRNVT